MATIPIYKLALIIKNSSNDNEFLLVKQTRPPIFQDEEYDSFIDSDLWELPSAQLNPLEQESLSQLLIQGSNSGINKLDLSKFDINSALNQVLLQLGFENTVDGNWEFWKYVEEPEFGPGPPIHTVFLTGKLTLEDDKFQDLCKWKSIENCLDSLLEVKPLSDRVGPLMVVGLLNDPAESGRCKIPPTLLCQEYPPGIRLVPMGSRTAKPFRTTNLIVIEPDNVTDGHGDKDFAAYGDALIVDPGCRSQFHEELVEIVATLPRKLLVFVTHHHHDHVDGLSIIQKCNPDAILLAHENTMKRIGKDDWSSGYTTVSGAEEICIGGQRLNVIFAPGHTDGHMALLHASTHSLIVGDHCVGQGSALLDVNSGGNMKDYFETTYKFLKLSPHALIPMHGRVNMWPKHLLCGYLKNRRSRESSILKAIESGSETLFDIVAKTYCDVNPSLWVPASWNVRLHVEYLAQQQKLPKVTSHTIHVHRLSKVSHSLLHRIMFHFQLAPSIR
ncbi:hypothetical protein AQUCO_04100044v1 [Aquilegia coerulea]|uniref:Metallo-beta-lactamase domain-containing protein n=1 Tax=Aquilegia coerulea TaxID=218851 RepID=A0A2G5CQ90_AQUCA|nr:hypothetical protein AQUCO_04100044v1 [Aquilegia coerulea]